MNPTQSDSDLIRSLNTNVNLTESDFRILFRGETEDFYPNESSLVISQPKKFYPNFEFHMILEYYLGKKRLIFKTFMTFMIEND